MPSETRNRCPNSIDALFDYLMSDSPSARATRLRLIGVLLRIGAAVMSDGEGATETNRARPEGRGERHE